MQATWYEFMFQGAYAALTYGVLLFADGTASTSFFWLAAAACVLTPPLQASSGRITDARLVRHFWLSPTSPDHPGSDATQPRPRLSLS